MAWEKISAFTERIAEKHRKLSAENEAMFDLPAEEFGSVLNIQRRRDNMRAQSNYEDCLYQYYQTVLQTGKFKYQREHCKEVLLELNPSLYKVIFKIKN